MTIKERIFFYRGKQQMLSFYFNRNEILHKKKKVKIEHVKEGQKVRSTVKRD